MVLTAATPKGGTGKSTLTVMTAAILAGQGKKVVIIDLDPSCVVSQCYGQTMQDFTTAELLTGECKNFQGIYPARENIDIVPGNIKNMYLNNILDTRLKVSLRQSGIIDRYDYILIDPPGYWGAHLRNAIFATEVLVIPANCSKIDFEVTKQFFYTLQDCGLDLDTYICLNSYNEKTNLPGIYEMYKTEFGEFLMSQTIPYIQSLKKLVNDVDYPLHAAVKKRLEIYVDTITANKEAINA